MLQSLLPLKGSDPEAFSRRLMWGHLSQRLGSGGGVRIGGGGSDPLGALLIEGGR